MSPSARRSDGIHYIDVAPESYDPSPHAEGSGTFNASNAPDTPEYAGETRPHRIARRSTRPADTQKIINAHAAARKESAKRARADAERRKAEQIAYNRRSEEDIKRRSDTASRVRYKSWQEQQKEQAKQATRNAKRAHTQARQAVTKRAQARQMASGAMSPAIGYALIALGAFDDILDLGTGFLPGVTTILQFVSATVQIIIILLDPGLRRLAWGARLKLLVKRWLIIAVAAFVEGIALGFNLLPFMTIAAFIARYMKSKAARR